MSLTGITEYLRPATLEEALALLGDRAIAVAGGDHRGSGGGDRKQGLRRISGTDGDERGVDGGGVQEFPQGRKADKAGARTGYRLKGGAKDSALRVRLSRERPKGKAPEKGSAVKRSVHG